jgi:hypothetical protein
MKKRIYSSNDFGGFSNYLNANKCWQDERLDERERSPFLVNSELWNTEAGRICELITIVSRDALLVSPRMFEDVASLIRQIGYSQESNYEEDFIIEFFRKWWNGKKYTFLEVISKLDTEARTTLIPQIKKKSGPHVVVTDLSAFVFCPVSYAIKKTFDLPKLPQVKAGLELHTQNNLEKFLSNLYLTIKSSDFNKSTLLGVNLFQDLLNSKIIFRGHKYDTNKPFFSLKRKLAGIPDYIFQREDGSYFVVEEKYTRRCSREIIAPWKSDIIQVLGYIYGLQEFKFTNGYVIYFPWSYEFGGQDLDRLPFENENHDEDVKIVVGQPKIFDVAKTESGKDAIINVYLSVVQFNENKIYPFDPNTINVIKCLNCSARFYCRHKAGFEDVIFLPYPEL